MYQGKFIVYGQPNCPGCETAKKMLSAYDFEYQEIGKYLSKEAFFAVFPNTRSVPLIVLTDGTIIGGIAQLKEFLKHA